ncbi:MAG TPA: hypothetical protein VGG91_10115 [Myxococcaceae bacterium]
MQLRRRLLPLLVLCSTGCYHASVETGRAAGSQHIEKGWAPGFFYGAVGPGTIDGKAGCSHGVSKVETKHSFLNSLVGGLTLGLYTPMTIDVTCAASQTATVVTMAPAGQTPQRQAGPAPNVAFRKAPASR